LSQAVTFRAFGAETVVLPSDSNFAETDVLP
jgi:hypothetical protein